MDTTALKTGATAPDFTLRNLRNQDVTLSSFFEIGKDVLLSFHPLAWTPVCEIQMRSLEIKKSLFDRFETVALGMSVDAPFAKIAWAEYMKMTETDMLADFWPHGEVARQYGIFDEEKGVSGRANFLISRTGQVKFAKVYAMREIPDIEEVLRFIENDSSRAVA